MVNTQYDIQMMYNRIVHVESSEQNKQNRNRHIDTENRLTAVRGGGGREAV